ncbi:MAG: hypothetical protein ACK6CE_14225 [Planctomycetota bacterium]
MYSYLARHWNPFWFTRLDARPLALFRIATGLLMLAMLLSLYPNWSRFYAADGMISLNSTGLVNPRVNSWLGLFYWTEGILPIEAFWPVSIALATLFLVGLKTRWATLGLLVLIDSQVHRNPYIVNGEELVWRMVLLYSLLIDLGATWSMDAWLRTRKGQPARTTVFAWPVRMMQINIALIYAISLPYKFAQDPGWVTGDAFHWTVASDMWGPSGLPWITLAFGGLFRKLITFGTVVVEAAFPALVWFEKFRRWVLLPIACLHVGIALMIPNVTFFTLSMVGVFPCFLTGRDFEDLARLGAWLKKRWEKPDTAPASGLGQQVAQSHPAT